MHYFRFIWECLDPSPSFLKGFFTRKGGISVEHPLSALGNTSSAFCLHSFWSETGCLWISFSPVGKTECSSGDFEDFFLCLSLIFRSLLWWLLAWVSLNYLFDVYSTSWACDFMSLSKSGKSWAIFISGAFSALPPLSFQALVTQILLFCCSSPRAWDSVHVFVCFLCCSDSQCLFLSPGWLTLFSVLSFLLLSTSPGLFISVQAYLRYTEVRFQTSTVQWVTQSFRFHSVYKHYVYTISRSIKCAVSSIVQKNQYTYLNLKITLWLKKKKIIVWAFKS